MADRGSDHRADDRRLMAAVAVAELVADGRTEQAAEDHRTRVRLRRRARALGVAHILIAGFGPALALRFADADVVIAVVRKRSLRGQQQSGRNEPGYYFGQHVALLELSPGPDAGRRGAAR